mmetsp:Transcript_86238/g.267930  ORF Transcript_86238/g.267930 Transcript_86238/m.267930 type:complete len:201 (-) Transcript_86238:80-682(-)
MAPLPSRSKAFDQASSMEPYFTMRTFWKSLITTCLLTAVQAPSCTGSRAASSATSKMTPERLTESRRQTLSHQARPPPGPNCVDGSVRTRWKPPALMPGTTKSWLRAGRQVSGSEKKGLTSWLSHAAWSLKMRSRSAPCSTTRRLPPASQLRSRTVSMMARPLPVLKRTAPRSMVASVPRNPRPLIQPSGASVSVTRCAE